MVMFFNSGTTWGTKPSSKVALTRLLKVTPDSAVQVLFWTLISKMPVSLKVLALVSPLKLYWLEVELFNGSAGRAAKAGKRK